MCVFVYVCVCVCMYMCVFVIISLLTYFDNVAIQNNKGGGVATGVNQCILLHVGV